MLISWKLYFKKNRLKIIFNHLLLFFAIGIFYEGIFVNGGNAVLSLSSGKVTAITINTNDLKQV